MAADARGGAGDALSGGQDDRAGLGAQIAAGPGRRMGQCVPGGDAGPSADDEGHGVSLSAADSGAAGGGCPRRVPGCVVQQHMAELMRERPGCCLSAEIGLDPDAPGCPHGGPVIRAAVLALDREPLAAGQPAQGVPQPWRGLTRARHAVAGRDGLPAGLG